MTIKLPDPAALLALAAKYAPIRKLAVTLVGSGLAYAALRLGLDLGSDAANSAAVVLVGLGFGYLERDPRVLSSADKLALLPIRKLAVAALGAGLTWAALQLHMTLGSDDANQAATVLVGIALAYLERDPRVTQPVKPALAPAPAVRKRRAA